MGLTVAVVAMIMASLSPWGLQVSLAAGGGASPTGTETVLPEVAGAVPQLMIPEESFYIEVIGFRIQGSKPWQLILVQDLECLVTSDKERYLPLLRILRIFGVDVSYENGVISFVFNGSPPAEVHIGPGRIIVDGSSREVKILSAVSPITQSRDYFLHPVLLEDLFGLTLDWSETEYLYLGSIERELKIWKISWGPSLLGVQFAELSPDVPELLPPAKPGDWGLDFAEVKFRSRGEILDRRLENRHLALDYPELSLWGSAAGGRYNLALTEPSLRWDGGDVETENDSFRPMIRWAELIFESARSEKVLGDSNFGLGTLIFPFLRFTGFRFNGIAGLSEEELGLVTSDRGFSHQYVRPHSFEGFARRGSTVELYINDRLIDTEEVLTEQTGAPPGHGIWRFGDVSLVPGIMNEIRIIVTEPSGISYQEERSVLGSALLLPRGATAYLGGIGTNRDIEDYHMEGFTSGARIYHGLTDRLTFGAMLAYQHNINEHYTGDFQDEDSPVPPAESYHAGLDLSWQILDALMLHGQHAWMTGSDTGESAERSGTASLIQGDFCLGRSFISHLSFFQYDPDYFNGNNIRPYDRQGATVSASWQAHPEWSFSGSAGLARNNLDRQETETLALDFQTFKVETSFLPWSNVLAEYDRLVPDSDDRPLELYSMRLNSWLPGRFTLNALYATGDSLRPEQDPAFFTGLNVPGIPFFQSPRTSFLLSKSFRSGNSLGLNYQKSGTLERASLIHNLRIARVHEYNVFTEAGYDIGDDQLFLENRIERFLSPFGQTRISLLTRLYNDEWSVRIELTMNELFNLMGKRLKRITGKGITPYNGAVHGVVFEDLDADGLRDPDEKGVEFVKVSSTSGFSAITDQQGFYILPFRRRYGEAYRVFINPDTIPATHLTTHGTQVVIGAPRTVTRVNLGIAPAHYATGYIYALGEDQKLEPLSGLHVILIRRQNSATVSESITAQDGSYYFGDLKPDNYILKIDEQTIPSDHDLEGALPALVVQPEAGTLGYDMPPVIFRSRHRKQGE